MSESEARKRVVSTGMCLACGEHKAKGSMGRHLATCARGAPGPVDVFEIVVSQKYDVRYWLHVDARGDATLDDLDSLLRRTWLECCGHMSQFTIGGRRFVGGEFAAEQLDPLDDDESDAASVPLARVLRKGSSFRHEYDFGTTTELQLKVTGRRRGELARANRNPEGARSRRPGSEKWVVVVARNDPPEMACIDCGAPATDICTACSQCGEGALCNACVAEHSCGDDMVLPLVNSPRTGVCDYTG